MENNLESSNHKLNKQIEDINLLKEQAESQTREALALSNNVSEAQKTTQEALKKSEYNEFRFSTILNTITDAVITISSKGSLK